MKTLVKIFVLCLTTTLFAQKPIEKTVGEFTELKVFDLIPVELIKSTENKVIISGENKSDVIVNNNNGKLKIKMKFEESFDGSDTKVVLYYTSVDVIDVNEGAKVESKDIIEQFEIDLRAQEGGMINVPLNVKYANIKAVTGGSIATTGTSKKQHVSLLTGGIYKGQTLITENTEVSINAAGEAYVNASKLVDAKIRAGGDVYIYGDPETVNESKMLGGRIERM
ncbi:head GIN domain-containing protein [Flavobacteriaceae bacterium SZ-1-7]|uniref:head GIN domain-containing protein n=1 Tax=Tamlana sedimenti TaxID=3134126 RepID=UPI00312409FD